MNAKELRRLYAVLYGKCEIIAPYVRIRNFKPEFVRPHVRCRIKKK
jgi:hypothetical protein